MEQVMPFILFIFAIGFFVWLVFMAIALLRWLWRAGNKRDDD